MTPAEYVIDLYDRALIRALWKTTALVYALLVPWCAWVVWGW